MTQELKAHQGDIQQDARTGSKQLQRARQMPALTPFDEIERLFDELLPAPMFRIGRNPLAARSLMTHQPRVPSIDLLERDEEIVLRAEVPGMRKDDLDISVDENSVTLRGTLSHEEKESGGDYYRQEISRGEFARSIPLPSAVDTEKARASLNDGVLELVLPKLEGAKRRRVRIE